MKKKIRSICIDGVERSGKTSVAREIRKFIKENDKDLYETNGSTSGQIQQEKILLEDNEKSIILKQKSLLSTIYNEF